MGKRGVLIKLLLLSVLTFATPAFSQEGMSESQNLIFRQTMSVGGSITKEMHEKFWSEVPKNAVGEWNPMFLFLLDNIKLGQTYQRALWQSALISYDQSEVIRTEALGESERALSLVIESAPVKKGTKEHDIFMQAYKSRVAISNENAKRLLEAAASHKDLLAVNGETKRIDEVLIKTVLEGLDASFERVKLLIDPVWRGPR